MIGVLAAFNHACGKSSGNGVSQSTNGSTNNTAKKKTLLVQNEISVQTNLNVNGLWCVLKISNFAWISGDEPPVGKVYIGTTSTNLLNCWIGDSSSYMTIDLLHSKGNAVERTSKGKAFQFMLGRQLLEARIEKRYNDWLSGKFRTPGFTRISAANHDMPLAEFSIAELFELKQSGDYTLKVQVHLVEEIGASGPNPNLKITLLPEIITKIHISPVENQ